MSEPIAFTGISEGVRPAAIAKNKPSDVATKSLLASNDTVFQSPKQFCTADDAYRAGFTEIYRNSQSKVREFGFELIPLANGKFRVGALVRGESSSIDIRRATGSKNMNGHSHPPGNGKGGAAVEQRGLSGPDLLSLLQTQAIKGQRTTAILDVR
jgi:hypothetical protein